MGGEGIKGRREGLIPHMLKETGVGEDQKKKTRDRGTDRFLSGNGGRKKPDQRGLGGESATRVSNGWLGKSNQKRKGKGPAKKWGKVGTQSSM